MCWVIDISVNMKTMNTNIQITPKQLIEVDLGGGGGGHSLGGGGIYTIYMISSSMTGQKYQAPQVRPDRGSNS